MTIKNDYLNPGLELEKRVEDLVSRMTVEEKISQMMNNSPAIKRLGIPKYGWWNECLHGVARAGIATVFPQAIGMAATWDRRLMRKIAEAISEEARAKYHDAILKGNREQNYGITFWSPNINIFRDPRWGRGQETYGEDPFLTGELGIEFVKGLQGYDKKYFKVIATPKHFAAHSGPEKDRHHFNAIVSNKDLEETYLPAFKKCVLKGKAYSVMGAYSRLNGEPCCASKPLLVDILRKKWGFKGYVVSDCDAIKDIYFNHKFVKTPEEAAAIAVKNGCDLNCGNTYFRLLKAYEKKLITNKEINESLKRVLRAKFKLGMFDPPEQVPFTNIPVDIINNKRHRYLALKAARESVVLLKNENNLLPVKKDLKSIAVIGPNADSLDALLGNYSGTPSKYVTPLQGIRNKVSGKTQILFSKGSNLNNSDSRYLKDAVDIAKKADVVIAVLGLNPQFEGEEDDAPMSDESGDRLNINLPEVQEELLKAVYKTGKPVILVVEAGSSLAINWAKEHIPAIIYIWYPGEEGGSALADVIFGNYNPGGRLPVTFYKSLEQLPPFDNYNMENRTYRFFKGKPLYEFGYGLSYTDFKYENLCFEKENFEIFENIIFSVDIHNVGNMNGEEVIQVYIKNMSVAAATLNFELKEFKRVSLKKGEKKKVSFKLLPEAFSSVDQKGKRFIRPGKYKIYIGGSQPTKEKSGAGINNILEKTIDKRGKITQIDSSF